jgi:hypothetical protein
MPKASPLMHSGWIDLHRVSTLSMGARFTFAVWASPGGGPSLFKVWTVALVLMALGEVITRVRVLVYRAKRTLAQAANITLELATA